MRRSISSSRRSGRFRKIPQDLSTSRKSRFEILSKFCSKPFSKHQLPLFCHCCSLSRTKLAMHRRIGGSLLPTSSPTFPKVFQNNPTYFRSNVNPKDGSSSLLQAQEVVKDFQRIKCPLCLPNFDYFLEWHRNWRTKIWSTILF